MMISWRLSWQGRKDTQSLVYRLQIPGNRCVATGCLEIVLAQHQESTTWIPEPLWILRRTTKCSRSSRCWEKFHQIGPDPPGTYGESTVASTNWGTVRNRKFRPAPRGAHQAFKHQNTADLTGPRYKKTQALAQALYESAFRVWRGDPEKRHRPLLQNLVTGRFILNNENLELPLVQLAANKFIAVSRISLSLGRFADIGHRVIRIICVKSSCARPDSYCTAFFWILAAFWA